MTQSPAPGWYADPNGVAAYRWWDGLAWTAHTTPGQPVNPVAQQGVYGGAMTTPWAPAAQFRPAAPQSGWQRNRYAFITLGVAALYALIAWKAHVYVLGVLPIVMSVRSKTRNEPLAAAAIIAAAVAVLVGVLGFTHH